MADKDPGSASILLLEDHPGDAELLLFEIGKSGLAATTTIARTKDEFIAALDQVPDLIVSDYSLPQFTAIDVLAYLRDRNLAIPLIVITGVLGDEAAAQCIKDGAVDYLLKDRLHRLPQAIEQGLDLARLKKKSSEDARLLAESEKRFRLLAEAIPQMVWVASADGAVTYLNARFANYIGAESRGADRPGRWEAFIHPEDRHEHDRQWSQAVATCGLYQTESRLRCAADGAWRWFLCRAFCEPGETGRPFRWFGTCTDIEDQKRNEETVRHEQKLDSLGLLAAGIAHDFNNLLAGIMGGASLASEMLPADHPAQPMLEIALQASDRASHLTSQMLAYAGKGQVLKERVALAKLIPETCILIAASLPKKVQIAYELEEDTPAVHADPGQLQQLVMNLVINAAEAIGDGGGVVTIRTGRAELSGVDFPDWAPGKPAGPGHYALIEVRDTGAGMDESTRARIFDPFFTTKFTGRGLGLAAVSGIVRSAKGLIAVESKRGQGTAFRVLLPAEEDAQPPVDRSGAEDSEPRRHAAEAVLIIDDEEIVRRTLAAMFSGLHFSVHLANDGNEGLELFEAMQNEISMVVLDIKMPGITTLETIKGLRRIRPGVPILIATGYSAVEVDGYLKEFDRLWFLAKPFRLSGIRRLLPELLARDAGQPMPFRREARRGR